jgi:hypothetical protein
VGLAVEVLPPVQGMLFFFSSLLAIIAHLEPRPAQFVEDEGEVVFYKDQYGRTSRQVVYESLPSDSGVDVN